MSTRLRWVDLFCACALLFGASVTGCSRPAPPPPTPAEIASLEPQLRAYLQRHIDAVHADPTDVAAQAELALVYEANAMWVLARQSFENVLQLDANHPLAQLHLAITLSRIGKTEAAEDWLSRAVESQPTLAPAWHRLGHMQLDRGDVDGAAEAFQEVITLAPNKPAGYVSLAAARLQQGEPAQALPLLERAIPMAPSYRMAHFLLGQCYMRVGRTEEARRELAQGARGHIRYLADEWSLRLRRHSQTLTAQLKKARSLYARGDAAGAAKVLEGAIAWHPKNVDALNNLAIVYMAVKRAPEAMELLHRAEQVDPNDSFTFTNLALCHLQMGKTDNALEMANRAITLAPQSADAHLTRGRVFLRQRRPTEAVQAFSSAVEYDPENLTARIALANTFFGMKEFSQAREQYRAALDKAPDLIPAMLRFCEACVHTGDYDDARNTIARLEQIGGSNAEVARAIQQLRERMGD